MLSQSTIKMDKGYYGITPLYLDVVIHVAIHNKNGQGLLQERHYFIVQQVRRRNPQ